MEEMHYHPDSQEQELTHDARQRFLNYANALDQYDSPHDALLDVYGLQLDGLLSRIHAAEAYFEEFPGIECIRVPVDPPMHGNEEGAGDPYFDLHRDTIFTLKEMASYRFDDLTELSGLGHELADDIVKSWDAVAFSWNELVDGQDEGEAA